jgi:hypothetical protein
VIAERRDQRDERSLEHGSLRDAALTAHDNSRRCTLQQRYSAEGVVVLSAPPGGLAELGEKK